MTQQLTISALTDVGRKRDHNEDAFGSDEGLGLYVVCDGMGGHASGEVASRLTVEHVIDFVRKQAKGNAEPLPYQVTDGCSVEEALLSNAVQHANDRVYIEGMKDPKLEGMGTTVVAMLARPDRLIAAHVGDSRIYRFNESDGLTQVTRDHSLLNHKIDMGELSTPDEIASFKQGNIIVRAIGLKDYVNPETQIVARRPGDVFLLCSDGLTDMVDDWSIQNVLEANVDTLDDAVTSLIKMANDRGGKDNITVLLLRIDDRVQQQEDEVTDPGGRAVFHEEDTHPGLDAVDPREEVTDPGGVQAIEDDAQVDQPSVTPEEEGFHEEDTAVGRPAFHEMETDPGRPAVDVDESSGQIIMPAGSSTKVPPPRSPARPSVSVQVQVQGGTSRMPKKGGPAPSSKPSGSPSIIVEPPSIIVDLD